MARGRFGEHGTGRFGEQGADAACFTTAATGLSPASRPGDELVVLHAMAADGVAPDAAACTVLLGVYACRLRLFDEACRLRARCKVKPNSFWCL